MMMKGEKKKRKGGFKIVYVFPVKKKKKINTQVPN